MAHLFFSSESGVDNPGLAGTVGLRIFPSGGVAFCDWSFYAGYVLWKGFAGGVLLPFSTEEYRNFPA